MSSSYYITRSALLLGAAALFVTLGGVFGSGVDQLYQLQAQTVSSDTLSETECLVLFGQNPDSPPTVTPQECKQYVNEYYNVPLTESECYVFFDQNPYSPPTDTPQECEQYVDEYYYTPLTKSECLALFDQYPGAPPTDMPTECEQHVDYYYNTPLTENECYDLFQQHPYPPEDMPSECETYADSYYGKDEASISEEDCHELFDALNLDRESAEAVGNDLGACEPYVESYFTVRAYEGSAPTCPFQSDTDVTVIDFTEYGSRSLGELVIRADGTEADATVAKDEYLWPGEYSVSLASYDPHLRSTELDTYGEQWKIVFYYENGERGVETPSSGDIGGSEELVTERIATKFEVPQNVTYMIAQHAKYPSTEAHEFVPICAQFKRTDDLEVTDTTTTTTTTTNEATTDTSTAETFVSDSEMNEESASTDPVAGTAADDTRVPTDTVGVAERYEQCPIPQAAGRILIDRTKGGTISVESLALQNTAAAIRSSTYLTPGTYRVTAATYAAQAAASKGSWRVVLRDASGTSVGETTTFIPNINRAVSIAPVATLSVDVLAVRVEPRRASDIVGTVAPLCFAFDLLDDGRTVEKEVLDDGIPENVTEPVRVVEDDITPSSVPEQDSGERAGVLGDGMVESLEGRSMPDSDNVTPLETATTVQSPTQEIPPAPAIASKSVNDQVQTLANESPSKRIESVRQQAAERADSEEVAAVEQIPLLRPLAARTPEVSSIALENERTMLKVRSEGEAAKDADDDGVSDHDEIYLYDTDPYNAYTSGGALSDGERIILGLDPHVRELVPVAVESPVEKEPILPELFAVEEITTVDSEPSTETQVGTKALRVQGTAPAHSFVTLYIFSTPIVVTVRADGEGRFDYTLDETLEDGTHTMYVTTVNERGSIVAQTQPIPFVQTAQAVDFTPIGADTDPVERVTPMAMVLMILLILTTVAGALVGIGMMHAREETVSV